MYRRNLLILIVSFIGFLSCKKKDDTVNFHHEYFPLEKGVFVEYDVTYIRHDDIANLHDTTKYSLKTLIGDTIIDNEGRIARKFYRYIFNTILGEYTIQDLWTIIIDQERAELVEENQRRIKMVFAPTAYKEWDMNAFNIDDPIYLYYGDIHKPKSFNGLDFDSTIVVEQDSTLNLIQYKRKYEVYGKTVGLLKKHFQDFSINNFDPTKPIKGEELFYIIKNYGKE